MSTYPSPRTDRLVRFPDGSIAPGLTNETTSKIELSGIGNNGPKSLRQKNAVYVTLFAGRGSAKLPVDVWFTPHGSTTRQQIAHQDLYALWPDWAHYKDMEHYGQSWAKYTGSVKYPTPATDGTITVTYASHTHEYNSDTMKAWVWLPRAVKDTAAEASFDVAHEQIAVTKSLTYKTREKRQHVGFQITNGDSLATVALQKWSHGNWVTVGTESFRSASGSFDIKASRSKTRYRYIVLVDWTENEDNVTSTPFTVQRKRKH